jgi:hypothetical protein
MTLIRPKKFRTLSFANLLLLTVSLFATSSLAIANQSSETASIETQFLSLTEGQAGYPAAALKHGSNPGADKTKSLRSFGSYISVALVGIIGFLLVFRGREIRRQHPKSLH